MLVLSARPWFPGRFDIFPFHPPPPRMYPDGILGTAHVGVQYNKRRHCGRKGFGIGWCSVGRRKGFLAFYYAAQSHPFPRFGPFLSPLLIP